MYEDGPRSMTNLNINSYTPILCLRDIICYVIPYDIVTRLKYLDRMTRESRSWSDTCDMMSLLK